MALMLPPNMPELWSVRPAAHASIYWKSIFKTKPGKVLQLNSGVLLGTDMVFPPSPLQLREKSTGGIIDLEPSLGAGLVMRNCCGQMTAFGCGH